MTITYTPSHAEFRGCVSWIVGGMAIADDIGVEAVLYVLDWDEPEWIVVGIRAGGAGEGDKLVTVQRASDDWHVLQRLIDQQCRDGLIAAIHDTDQSHRDNAAYERRYGNAAE